MKQSTARPMAALLRKRSSKGVVLLEAMIAAILLVIGLMGILKLISSATVTVTDGGFRALATERCVEILEEIRIRADRTNMDADPDKDTLRKSLETYVHQPTGKGETCNFSGTSSGNPVVVEWIQRILKGVEIGEGTGERDEYSRLPGTTDNMLQITYDKNKNNLVTVNICWQGPDDEVPRRQEMSAYIN